MLSSLAHGEYAEEVTELLVRFPEELHKGSEQSVKGEEHPEHHTGGCLGTSYQPEQEEQYRPLEKCFVEL